MKGELKLMWAIVAAGAIAGFSASVSIAETTGNYTVIATGLNAPRGIKFGPDGDLYVAEAGKGGTNQTTTAQCAQVNAPVGPYTGGSTGSISKVDRRGRVTVVASGLPSAIGGGGALQGVADVAFLDGELYALLAGGGCSHGNPETPNGIVKVDTATGKWRLVTNLSAFTKTHPGAYAANDEPDGDWYNMIVFEDRLTVVNPNGDIIAKIDSNFDPHLLVDVSASQGHAVTTSLTHHDIDLYVGTLFHFPIQPQQSRVLRISRDGSIGEGEIPGFEHRAPYYVADSKAGFTTLLKVAFGPDGLLYALEFSDAAGDPAPGNGKVVRVNSNGAIEELVSGLIVPGGMTFGPDGHLYVADGSAIPAPAFGKGRILKIDLPPGS